MMDRRLKIRIGFVTNSSSTNHIIAWNGDNNDLRTFLEQNRWCFPTDSDLFPDYQITQDEIIEAIMSKVGSKTTVEEEIFYIEETIKREEEAKKLESDSWAGFYDEYIGILKKRMEFLRGKENVLMVSFGDHHGDFQNGELGCIMDYEGREIEIRGEDFSYTTEQDR